MHRNVCYLLWVILLLGLISNIGTVTARTDKEKVVSLDTDPNLVGWWKFDDTSGTTAVDSSRYKRKGLLKGDLSFKSNSAPGRIGKAIKLDGEDDYIQISGYKGVTGTGPRTVSAWIKTRPDVYFRNYPGARHGDNTQRRVLL
ncbi:MAG: hypothetical protein ACYSWP_25465 [Planctomycetota bacterium]|jgi:hypothetical protein